MELRHGTNRGWEAGCRERCCRDARNRFHQKKYDIEKMRGLPGRRIPVERVRDKVDYLQRNYDYSFSDISRETGIHKKQLSDWMNKSSFVYSEKVHRLLELNPREHSATGKKGHVSAAGTTRRIQAMYLRGFGSRWISRRSGVHFRTIGRLASGKQLWVTEDTQKKISNTFTSTLLLSDLTGVYADRVRNRGIEDGFLPAGVWEDIDDPECEPDSLLGPEAEDAIIRCRRLHARGFLLSQIAEESGFHKSNLSKLLLGNKKSLGPDQVKKLVRACDSLEPLPDPEGRRHDVARNTAEKRGWR